MTAPRGYVVTGTDTDVGKTVFAAGLAAALGADYWKPVQAGLEGGDRQRGSRAPGARRCGACPKPIASPRRVRRTRPREIDGVTHRPGRA